MSFRFRIPPNSPSHLLSPSHVTDNFANLNKPAGYRTRIVLEKRYEFDGIPSAHDGTEKTVPLWNDHNSPSRPSLETLSTDDYDDEEYFDDDKDGRFGKEDDKDDWYDHDELFRDDCCDDSSMSRFLRKIHKTSPPPPVYRIPSAAAGRTSAVSCFAREA